jgi:Zn-dependent peptidase ImmA (M78 family)/predicted secreted protein
VAERSRIWRRRIEAAEAAISLLDEAGIDQTRQIDVFGLCERLGLWLAFVPLDNALGAFVPTGSGGVLITTNRPLTVQRYTVAHELGHWRLDHGVVTDRQEQIFGAPPAEQERLAQIFAGTLLMPAPLVMAILQRIRPSAEPLTAERCYALAREAGVSYEAAVRQLVNLDQLSASSANELLRQRPLAIKTELGHGRRPVNGWADVWPVDERWDDHILTLRLDDEAVISLPENRSTGYRWMLADAPHFAANDPAPSSFATAVDAQHRGESQERFLRSLEEVEQRHRAPQAVLRRLRARAREVQHDNAEVADRAGVDVVGDQYVPMRAPTARARDTRAHRLAAASPNRTPGESTEGHFAGATGRRLLGIRFGRPGAHTIRLAYRSPYTDSPAAEAYSLHAVVETRRNAISVSQISSGDDRETWVREVHERQASAVPPPLDPNDPALAD